MADVVVGNIVQFFGPNWAEGPSPNPALVGPGYNGQGAGPYAAIVTQVFNEAYVNLLVLVPFSDPVHVGSVPEKGSPYHYEGGAYWVWP